MATVFRWSIAAAGIALGLAVLGYGALLVAGLFVTTDPALRDYALSLTPPDAEVLVAESDQCTRSGWPGVFTLSDTCFEVRWGTAATATDGLATVKARAEADGWTVTSEGAGGLDLVRPGFRAVVRANAADVRESCLATAAEPVRCHNFTLVTED